MNEVLKSSIAEGVFLALTLVVVLLILPLWSATAMLVGSILGLAAYVIVFRERLRGRGWLRAAAVVALAAALAAIVAMAISLI
jgi:hypothetical protein